MTKIQILALHFFALLAAASGAVYAWMKYFVKSDDPYAVVNHPWQSYVLDAHVVVAPLLLFSLGIVYGTHVSVKLGAGSMTRRKSGLSALVMIIPMVLSGYLLQVLTNESALQASRVVHWVSSALFVFGYGVHIALKARNGTNGAHGTNGT